MLEHLQGTSTAKCTLLSKKHQTSLGAFAFASICGAIGLAALFATNTYAVGAPQVSIEIKPSVGNNNINPGNNAASAHYFVPVRIVTSNTEKYSVMISGSTNLTGTRDSNNIIQSIQDEHGVTLDNMNNEWGYRWSESATLVDTEPNAGILKLFEAMPVNPTAIITDKATINNASDSYLNLAFGAKVDGSKPSDDYTGTVTVSVVASPMQATIYDINTMQQMTNEICAATATPTVDAQESALTEAQMIASLDDVEVDGSIVKRATKVPETTLTDTRDQKTYLIRKLADGNCWMSQNLELDFLGPENYKNGIPEYYNGITTTSSNRHWGGVTVGSNSLRFTDEDTDLHSLTEWTPEIAGEKYKLTSGKFFFTYFLGGDQNIADDDSRTVTASSENPIGLPVYTTQSGVGSTPFGWKTDGTDGIRSLSITDNDPNQAYAIPTGTYNADGSMAFANSATGEPYQRRGNLYNWTAATLGSSLNATQNGDKAADSICPKGWQLPELNDNRSFINLLESYDPAQNWQSDDNITGFNKINSFPLNFSRTGLFYHSNGTLSALQTNGYWWSNTARSTTHAYHMLSASTEVYAKYSFSRGFGFAIRCVAR